MVRTRMNIGDEVVVYLNTPEDAFTGKIIRINDSVSNDVWYEVKPHGDVFLFLRRLFVEF